MDRKAEITRQLIDREYVKSGAVSLNSGTLSNLYFDLRTPFRSDPHLKDLSIEEYIQLLNGIPDFQRIADMPDGSSPIVASLADRLRPVTQLTVRKKPKEHGLGGLIIGRFDPGDRVVVVDDVSSRGSSIMHAVRGLRKNGLVVNYAVVLVDRGEGAKENLEKEGVQLHHAFTKEDFK